MNYTSTGESQLEVVNKLSTDKIVIGTRIVIICECLGYPFSYEFDKNPEINDNLDVGCLSIRICLFFHKKVVVKVS